MAVQDVDRDPLHLYLVFRDKLTAVLDKMAQETGETWRMTEGYRSQDRQLWLYGQGRPSFTPYGRSGNIVTWTLKSKHKSALAADVIPSQTGYHAPYSWWQKLRTVYQAAGLENPAWDKGDTGHIQWPGNDTQTYVAAAAWVAQGFPDVSPAPPPAPRSVDIFVDGVKIPDAQGFLLEDRAWCALRPVATALDWIIAEAAEQRAVLLTDGRPAVTIPLRILAGTGYSRVRDMGELAQSFVWDEQNFAVQITSWP